MRPGKGIRARCTAGRKKKIKKSLGGNEARCNHPETGETISQKLQARASIKVGASYRELGWMLGPLPTP